MTSHTPGSIRKRDSSGLQLRLKVEAWGWGWRLPAEERVGESRQVILRSAWPRKVNLQGRKVPVLESLMGTGSHRRLFCFSLQILVLVTFLFRNINKYFFFELAIYSHISKVKKVNRLLNRLKYSLLPSVLQPLYFSPQANHTMSFLRIFPENFTQI